jgi:hypothetical protein
VPVEAVPVEAVPVEAVPVEAVPVEAVPVEAVPVEATDVTAEVADEAVDVTAEVTDVATDVGESAACACFDRPSRTATMPMVKIAIWAARRAMCRNVGWDTKSSRSVGRGGETGLPTITTPKPAGATDCGKTSQENAIRPMPEGRG